MQRGRGRGNGWDPGVGLRVRPTLSPVGLQREKHSRRVLKQYINYVNISS